MSRHVPIERLEMIQAMIKSEVDAARKEAVFVPGDFIAPFDGGPAVRPWGKDGKHGWQIWQGGICIALLDHEHMTPVIERYLASPQAKT